MQTAGVLEAFSNGDIQAPWSLVKDSVFDVNTKLVVASGSMVVMETFPDWDKVVTGFYPDTERDDFFPQAFCCCCCSDHEREKQKGREKL